MKKFRLPNKIVWIKNNISDASETFYPSFYKETIKRESFFENNFEVQFLDADIDKLKNIFLPLYLEEVASKKDFTLGKDYIVNKLMDSIKNSDLYKFIFVYHKDKLVIATLFSLKNNGLYICNRAFDRDFDKKLSHGATISYWMEKLIFEYGINRNVKFFSRGKDTHPYTGKSRIGLPLYKFKTGFKPRKPMPETKFIENDMTEGFFRERNEPILFFYNEDSDGFCKDAYLYYPPDSISRDYLNEFKKVIEWSGLNFISFEY